MSNGALGAGCRDGGADRTARSSSSSPVTTAPPSPVVTIFRGWNERQPATPSEPHGSAAVPCAERAGGVLEQRRSVPGRRRGSPPRRPAGRTGGRRSRPSSAGRDRVGDQGGVDVRSCRDRRRRGRRARRRARPRSRSRGRCRRARSPRRRGRPRARAGSEVERGRARRDDRGVRGAAGARDRVLERGDLRPHRQHPGRGDLGDARQPRPRRRRVERGGSALGSLMPSRRAASDTRRSCARDPRRDRPAPRTRSATRALSTFGMRSSTSV